eukprot:6203286-Pleurochrysis_carterae.AAC.1
MQIQKYEFIYHATAQSARVVTDSDMTAPRQRAPAQHRHDGDASERGRETDILPTHHPHSGDFGVEAGSLGTQDRVNGSGGCRRLPPPAPYPLIVRKGHPPVSLPPTLGPPE